MHSYSVSVLRKHHDIDHRPRSPYRPPFFLAADQPAEVLMPPRRRRRLSSLSYAHYAPFQRLLLPFSTPYSVQAESGHRGPGRAESLSEQAGVNNPRRVTDDQAHRSHTLPRTHCLIFFVAVCPIRRRSLRQDLLGIAHPQKRQDAKCPSTQRSKRANNKRAKKESKFEGKHDSSAHFVIPVG